MNSYKQSLSSWFLLTPLTPHPPPLFLPPPLATTPSLSPLPFTPPPPPPSFDVPRLRSHFCVIYCKLAPARLLPAQDAVPSMGMKRRANILACVCVFQGKHERTAVESCKKEEKPPQNECPKKKEAGRERKRERGGGGGGGTAPCIGEEERTRGKIMSKEEKKSKRTEPPPPPAPPSFSHTLVFSLIFFVFTFLPFPFFDHHHHHHHHPPTDYPKETVSRHTHYPTHKEKEREEEAKQIR